MSNRRLSDRAWFDEHVKIITVNVPPAPMFGVVAEGEATIDDTGDVTLNLTPVDDCVHCFDDGTPVYDHDEHETPDAYRARQEADLIREALAIARERDR